MADKRQAFAPQVRSFDLNRASINEDARTVDVIFSTETDQVERWFGREILDHGLKSVRLDRLKNSAPLLLEHNSREQIGVIESAAINGKQGTATVRFSKSEKAQEIFEDIKDGIRSKVSVGYRVHGIVLESSDKKTGTDTYRVTDWEPFEISIVSIPADDSAGVRGESTESIFGQRAAELTTYIAMSKPEENQDRAADTENKNPVQVAKTPEAPETGNRAAEIEKLSEAEIEARAKALATEQTRAELARIDEIRAIGERAGIPAAEIEKAKKDGETVEAFKARTFDILAAKNPPISTPRGMDSNENKPKRGTIAEARTAWAQSAVRSIESRGIQVTLPDYSREDEPSKRTIIGGEDARRPIHRSLVGSLTLADKVTIDAGIGAAIVNEVVVAAPEADVFPVDVFDGDTVTLSVETGTGTVGFRNANEGSPLYKGTFESRIFQAQVLDVPIQVDVQGVLRASKDPGRFLEAQTRNRLKAVVKHIGVQTWYAGTQQSGADAKSAPGLLAQSISAATHVVDATGTTGKTSVYLVRLGAEDGASHLYGNGATITMGSEWDEETVEDANGKKFRALVNFISGRVAPKLANKNSLVRIKNVSAESGKTLTASLLRQAISLALENGMEPNAIFMTPRSQLQLSASYDATLIGMGRISPLLNEFEGIPLYVSNSISNAETV